SIRGRSAPTGANPGIRLGIAVSVFDSRRGDSSRFGVRARVPARTRKHEGAKDTKIRQGRGWPSSRCDYRKRSIGLVVLAVMGETTAMLSAFRHRGWDDDPSRTFRALRSFVLSC